MRTSDVPRLWGGLGVLLAATAASTDVQGLLAQSAPVESKAAKHFRWLTAAGLDGRSSLDEVDTSDECANSRDSALRADRVFAELLSDSTRLADTARRGSRGKPALPNANRHRDGQNALCHSLFKMSRSRRKG